MVGPVKVRDSNGQLKYYLYVVSTGLGGSLDGLDSGYSCFKRKSILMLRFVDLAIVLTGIKSGTLLGATVIRCRRN